MALTREQKNQALDIFDTPVMFRPEALMMLSEQELEMILLLGTNKEAFYEADLEEKLAAIAKFPKTLIRSAYSRCVLKKVRDGENRLMYQLTDFYSRYPFFAQFEFEEYVRIPRDRRVMMNDWDYEVYSAWWKPVVQQKLDGYDAVMHDDHFMTLEEAQKAVKEQEEVYLVPCNCKYMMDVTDRPRNVCTHFWGGDNSAWDRGHGQRVTGERCAELLVEWNKRGLMPNGRPEFEGGFCNCDGASCYPIRMGKEMNARGYMPRANWWIHWDADKCISCGKCAKICNFQAFTAGGDGKIVFHPDKCWGCTICTNNCPKGAITKTPRKWDLKPLPQEGNGPEHQH